MRREIEKEKRDRGERRRGKIQLVMCFQDLLGNNKELMSSLYTNLTTVSNELENAFQ